MKKNVLIIITIAIFLLLSGVYAFYITPPTLSEGPDESGHFSYIHHLQVENKLPVLNETFFYVGDEAYDAQGGDLSEYKAREIDDTMMDKGVNWIVQHPPFYYMVMALVLKVVRLFSDNLVIAIYAIRLATMMLGALLLVFCNKFLDLLKAEKPFKIVFLGLLAFSPMLQFYFSVISNDSMLILVTTISLYYLIKYQKTNRLLDMALFTIFTSLIVLTKYTGCLIVIPYGLYFIYVFFKAKPKKRAWLNLLVCAMIAGVLIAPHLVRNYHLYQKFLPTRNPIYQESFDYDFFSFIKIGYIAELFKHLSYFVGWYHFVGAWKLVRLLYMLIFGAGVLMVSFWQNRQVRLRFNTLVLILLGGMAALMFAADFYYAEKSTALFSYGAIIILAALLYRFYTETMHTVIKTDTEKGDMMMLFIASILVVFIGLMYTHYNLFNRSGLLIATHGRYYYGLVFPFTYLVVRSYMPLLGSKKWAKVAIACILAVYIFADIYIMTYTASIWH
ncbi:MAG: DUF2142 domain-containing protein [Eubacteriales bacterium]